jgi:hypothetical protein
MPAMPPIALSKIEENEKTPAPHSAGINPPMVDPTKSPIQISARDSIICPPYGAVMLALVSRAELSDAVEFEAGLSETGSGGATSGVLVAVLVSVLVADTAGSEDGVSAIAGVSPVIGGVSVAGSPGAAGTDGIDPQAPGVKDIAPVVTSSAMMQPALPCLS